MQKRTIRVLGWGANTQPSQLTATLDGDTVFSGSVSLEPKTSANDSVETAPILFSFELPLEFAGVKRMKIINNGSNSIEFGQVIANYTLYTIPTTQIESGPFEFLDIGQIDEHGARDPRTNVVIDGRAQTPNRNGVHMGTWHWTIGPDSTFEHDLVISAGVD